jgi:hypothetical protein
VYRGSQFLTISSLVFINERQQTTDDGRLGLINLVY